MGEPKTDDGDGVNGDASGDCDCDWSAMRWWCSVESVGVDADSDAGVMIKCRIISPDFPLVFLTSPPAFHWQLFFVYCVAFGYLLHSAAIYISTITLFFRLFWSAIRYDPLFYLLSVLLYFASTVSLYFTVNVNCLCGAKHFARNNTNLIIQIQQLPRMLTEPNSHHCQMGYVLNTRNKSALSLPLI